VNVETHAAARRELAVAANRLTLARPGYGARFREATRKALRDIGETPHSFPPDEDAPDGFEVRYVPLSKYSYRIVFAVLESTALVLAVAHDGREPRYWTERLPAPAPEPGEAKAPVT